MERLARRVTNGSYRVCCIWARQACFASAADANGSTERTLKPTFLPHKSFSPDPSPAASGFRAILTRSRSTRGEL